MTDAEKALLEAVLSNAEPVEISRAKHTVHMERLGPLEHEVRSLCRELIRVSRSYARYREMLGSVADRIYEEELLAGGGK